MVQGGQSPGEQGQIYDPFQGLRSNTGDLESDQGRQRQLLVPEWQAQSHAQLERGLYWPRHTSHGLIVFERGQHYHEVQEDAVKHHVDQHGHGLHLPVPAVRAHLLHLPLAERRSEMPRKKSSG